MSNRLNEALKGVKKYRAKAKESKKRIKEKIYDYRTKDGYAWDDLISDIKKEGAALKAERLKIEAEQKALSAKEREERKKAMQLWCSLLYWSLKLAVRFIPVGAPIHVVLKVLSLLRFYGKFK
jgi:hypothetical protein